MLLLPTVALVAGAIVSVVVPPEHPAAAETTTVQAALPSGYLLYGDLEQQP